MDIAAVGAFLSGAGAIVSAYLSLRVVQRRNRQECAERIAEIKAAIHEGYGMKDE